MSRLPLLMHLTFGLFLVLNAPVLAQDIQITNAYARATLRSGAIYFTLANVGALADRLLSASTDVARSATLHSTTVTDGIASMPSLPDGLIVPANGEISLARGANHIMLMGLDDTLEQGATFPVTLTFEVAGSMTIDVTVDNLRELE